MLEFIQAILGIIVKALPAAVNRRHGRHLNKLGADLFIFYIQVNEALICAEIIMAELEEFVDRMTRHADVGDNYAIRAGGRISRPVQLQCENLIRIATTMERLKDQLQVVDGQAYAKISVLLSSKAEALDTLIGTMRNGLLPIPLELAGDLQALMESVYDRDPLIPDHRLADKTYCDISENSISLASQWDVDIYRRVADYLERNSPRRQIAQIGIELENIRTGLEKNFSLKEILLAVGDDHFKHGDL